MAANDYDYNAEHGEEGGGYAAAEPATPQGAAVADLSIETEKPNLVMYHHPEAVIDYLETVLPKVPLRVAPPVNAEGADPGHTSPPFLTVYERTKILGTRATQLADGAKPFVVVPDHVTTPLEIAKLELEQRVLPFIVKRPMPDGTFEYWRLSDLLLI